MKQIALFMAVVVAAVLSGCASISEAKPADMNGCSISYSGKPVAHVQAENWGIYFFVFPLITGSTETPGKMEFLKDTVKLENVVDMLTKYSKAQKASKTYNMVSTIGTTPWFFGFKQVNVSANLLK